MAVMTGVATPVPRAPRAGRSDAAQRSGSAALALAALGVVFGDIGTSPLYAMQAVFASDHGAVKPVPADVYGIVSLVAWSITLVVSIKFVTFVMRADNRGDGGVLALVTLVRQAAIRSRRVKRALVAAGLLGVALFYGDGMITPAISVLSAVEGIEVAAPGSSAIVLPVTLGVLVALFALQRFGTHVVGRLFGPVMVVWFAALAAVGLARVGSDPGILRALSPSYAAAFFTAHPGTAFLSLGAVVLVVTGSEALYADMGHFGRRPISRAWFFVVFPALMLNYMGQGSLILESPHATSNPFYLLFPAWAQAPMIVLATAATLIASQAVISGAFSVTRQAVHLGFLPRLRIEHTSAERIGQVYLPAVNWTLCAAVIGLVLGFGSSEKLGVAYGIAVTGTLLVDSVLFLVVARVLWGKSLWAVCAGVVAFVTVDVVFLAANLPKIASGGWLPLVVAAAVFVVLTTWNRGRKVLTAARTAVEGSLRDLVEDMRERSRSATTLPTVGVYLHATRGTAPLALRVGYDRLRAIPEQVVIVTVDVTEDPHVSRHDRVVLDDLGSKDDGFSHVTLRYGYRDRLDVPRALGHARRDGRLETDFNPYQATYFVSQMEIVPGRDRSMPRWRKALFVAMARNATNPADFLNLPRERVVTLGTQVGF